MAFYVVMKSLLLVCTLSDTLVLGSGSEVADGPFNPLTAIAISWSVKLINGSSPLYGGVTTRPPAAAQVPGPDPI